MGDIKMKSVIALLVLVAAPCALASSVCTSGSGSQVVTLYVEATVGLNGITPAQFNARRGTVKDNFKAVVAEGITGATAADVEITEVKAVTGGTSVKFRVKVASAAAQTAGVTSLTTFLNDSTSATGFLKKLQAKGGALGAITGVTVLAAPKGTSVTTSTTPTPTPTVLSGVSKNAMWPFTGMAAMALALLQ